MGFEQLEDRRLLALVGPMPVSSSVQAAPTVVQALWSSNPDQQGIYLIGSTLKIQGGTGGDKAIVSQVAGQRGGPAQIKVSFEHTVWEQIGGDALYDPMNPEGFLSDGLLLPLTTKDPDYFVAVDKVSKIVFFGDDGDDVIINNTSILMQAYGGDGCDWLTGGSGVDKLYGEGDGDTLEGKAGNDILDGGAGHDTFVFAGQGLGADKVYEAPNADSDELDFSQMGLGVNLDLSKTIMQAVSTASSTLGGVTVHLRLTLSSGTGIEKVTGSAFGDTIVGNDRDNWLDGAAGNDTLTGLAGNDTLTGGLGNDTLSPGTGANSVSDGPGNDWVDFSQNDVGIYYSTGGGNDTIIGTAFDDTITGSSGNDYLDGGAGDNTLYDGLGDDTIDFSENTLGIVYYTQGGNDTVIGTPWQDHIYGSSGDDFLMGRGGNDRLFGQDGNDTLDGGDDNDWLEAGSASEMVIPSAGTDYNAHVWAIGGSTFDDINQGNIGTCVFLSSLSGAAMQGIDLAGRITYLGNYTYQVQLFNWDSESPHNELVNFSGLWAWQDGMWTSEDPIPAVAGEFWAVLYQRAYLQMMAALDENFKDPDYAMYALTGREVEDGDCPEDVKAALEAGKVVTAGNADDGGLVYENHSYTVMEVYQMWGTWYIKLRNPWGNDVGSDSDHYAYGDPTDGIIVMTWEKFWSPDHCDFDRLSIS